MSADFSMLSAEPTISENRKRVMGTPFSLPCRPRQLMNCCARKNLEEPQQLPSPSTEFSKLDISLANPCLELPRFGTANPISFDSQSQPQTSTHVENPVFGLLDNEGKNQKSKSTKKSLSNHHHLFNLFTRRPAKRVRRSNPFR